MPETVNPQGSCSSCESGGYGEKCIETPEYTLLNEMELLLYEKKDYTEIIKSNEQKITRRKRNGICNIK